MWFKRILRVGLFITCWFVSVSVEAKIHDRGYVLILNSYTDVAIWSNYAIDSLIKDPSIKEDVCVESLNMLLVDDETGAEERREDIQTKYSSKPSCTVVLGNSALCVFRKFFDGIWKDVPVVLCAQEFYVSPLNVLYQKK